MPDLPPCKPSVKPVLTKPIAWQEAVDQLCPRVLRIATPECYGTGFVLTHSEAGDFFGVATAAHVVTRADEWRQPIRLEHNASDKPLLLQPKDRIIFTDPDHDTAMIVFDPGLLKLPPMHFPLIEEGYIIKVGVEIGWLGFPVLSPKDLCFFSGRVSAHISEQSGYLVDGVAINGVSGGPAVCIERDKVYCIGVVSQYIPNRATGEPLPGLAVIRTVSQFYGMIKDFRSLDDARKQQAGTSPPPLPKQPPNTTPPAKLA